MGSWNLSPRNTVGRQAFVFLLTVSLAFVVLSSAILLAVEYSAKKKTVYGEAEAIRASQVEGIAEGLWNFDARILQALADGIVHYPYFNFASIEDGRGLVARGGESKAGSAAMEFPISRRMPGGGESTLGVLRVEIDSGAVLADVIAQALPTVALQVLLLVVESFVVLLFLSRTATRHLSRIAAYIREYDVRPDAPPLVLDKKDRGDELDLLANAYNHMRKDVAASREAEVRAMKDLVLSEERSRILVEEAPDAIMMYDIDAGVFVDCNRRAERVFGRGRDELIGADPIFLYSPESYDGLPIRESIDRSLALATTGEPVMVRRRILRPGGDVIDCEVRLNLLPSSGHRIIRLSYLDVTERVRAEESVARSLREKEVLVQEVYHRTKNNMQLISSFLDLEAEASGDERVASKLREMIGRISSMALVHQKLYESEDLSRIDLGDYIEDLVLSIRSAYVEARRGIGISVEAEPGIISVIDIAIPFGLVLNELVVNSLKHAFAGRASGSIRVSLRRTSPHELELSVSDDGAGFPAGYDFRRDGHVGLQTVVSIVELQLRGSVAFETGRGTTWTAVVRDNMFGARV
jgi:two-component system, sensor histidine kinase PdtaS